MARADGRGHPLQGRGDLVEGLELVGLLVLVYDVLVCDSSGYQVSVVSNAVYDAFQVIAEVSKQILSNSLANLKENNSKKS